MSKPGSAMAERDTGRQALATLAREFITLIKGAPGGEIELATAETKLSVQRRRLYDVTNILAGVGLLERSEKSKVKWIGQTAEIDTRNVHQVLVDRDQELDTLTVTVDELLVDLMKSSAFQEHAWFAEEDVALVDPTHTLNLFAIRGPETMTMEPGDEDDDCHQLTCRTEEGQIEMIPIHIRPRPPVSAVSFLGFGRPT
jgi:hypothetical protein